LPTPDLKHQKKSILKQLGMKLSLKLIGKVPLLIMFAKIIF